MQVKYKERPVKTPRKTQNAVTAEERSQYVFIRPENTVHTLPCLRRTKHFKMGEFPGILTIMFSQFTPNCPRH